MSALGAIEGCGRVKALGRALGAVLDPFYLSPYEKQQREIVREMNSPAAQMIQAEQRRRESEARRNFSEQMLMQAYMQGIN